MKRIQQFFADVLEKSGAMVEVIEPEGLEVLAPAQVQQVLQVPEWVRLGFGTELPSSARRVGLESELMGRAGALLGEQGRYLRRVYLPENPPPNNPERVLLHTLDLRNATYRLQQVAPAWTCYLILRFRYSAISDDKHDGLLDFGLNLTTGATLDAMLPELLTALDTLIPVPAPPANVRCTPWPPHKMQSLLGACPAAARAPHAGRLLQRHASPPGTRSAAAL